MENLEISKKGQKSLITVIKIKITPIQTIKKWTKICVIKRAQGSLTELSFESKSSHCKDFIELLKYNTMKTQELLEIIQKTESPLIKL